MEQTPKNYLSLSPDDLEKVKRAKSRHERETVKVDPEWMFVAAFGKAYGWGGVMAILNDEISGEMATILMAAAEKLDYQQMYRDSQSSLIGSVSANSKRPGTVFNKMTKEIVRNTK